MPGAVPKYYCMPDDRGSLATPPWNTAWLMETMHKKKFRIAANEWDAFPRSKFGIEVSLCCIYGASYHITYIHV